MRFLTALVLSLSFLAAPALAEMTEREQIDTRVANAVSDLRTRTDIGGQLIDQAAGVLVFPRVVKAAIGIGGSYGKGALLVNGRPDSYYEIAAGSFGFQLGAQSTSQFILFMTRDAMQAFKNSDGWEAGVDGNITLIDTGASGRIDTEVAQNPVLGFVIGNKGLLAGVSLEGSKISPIAPQ